MFLTVLLEASAIAGLSKVGAAFAASIIVFAASMGIGKLATAAMEAIARQPEAGADIRSSMILAAALIEGVSMFAVVVCLLVLFV